MMPKKSKRGNAWKRTNIFKKGLSGLLAFSMVASTIVVTPSSVSADPVTDPNLLVHYDMSHADGKLTDVSGKGNHGTLHGISDLEFKQNYTDNYLDLTGTGYVDIPLSIADGLDYDAAFSVEMTLIPKTQQYQFLWTIGTGNQTNYLALNPRHPCSLGSIQR